MQKIRASSLPTLFDCSLRWYFEHVEGLIVPSSTKARVGTAVHTGAAAFDRGASSSDAADAAHAAFMDPQGDVEKIGQLDINAASAVARRTTIGYATTFGRRAYSHIEVEVPECIVSTIHGDILLTGHVDRVLGGQVHDLKTGEQRVTKDGRVHVGADHLQMGVYAVMARAELGDDSISPNVTITGGSTSHYTWGEITIANAVQVLLGDAQYEGIIVIAAKMIKHGVFPPNPKSLMCSAKYCAAHSQGKCRFHG